MKTTLKLLAGAAGLAALTAAPAAAQYYPGYSYGNNYGYGTRYGSPYGNAYAYGYSQNNTNVLAQRCTAAVQQRLYTRTSRGTGISGILGAILGANVQAQGRVLNVTQVTPNRSTLRVRGLATSGRAMAYNPYGVGYYGSTAYGMQPDLSYKCDIDYNGYIRDIDIYRR
jgi:hypothetical protein